MIGTFLPQSPKITVSEGVGELFTFPITVSMEEPTNPSIGDLWVKTDKIFSKMHFVDAITLTEENDTLIFMINNEFEYSLKGKYTISDSNMSECMVDIKTFTINNGAKQYSISKINDENNLIMNFSVSQPKVYSKKDDAVVMEDAYIYTEQGWGIISRKSTLVILGSGYNSTTTANVKNNPSLYNNIDGELSFIEYVGGTAIKGGTNVQTFNNPNYVLITYTNDSAGRSGIYKLNGDHLEEYFIFSETMNLEDGEYPGKYTCLPGSLNGDKYINPEDSRHLCANDDFSELLVYYISTSPMSSCYIFRAVRFKNNGTTFIFDKTVIELKYSSYEGLARTSNTIVATNDLSFLLFSYGYVDSSNYNHYARTFAYFKNKEGDYDLGSCSRFSGSAPHYAMFNFSKTFCLTLGNPYTSNVGSYPMLIKIDYDKKTANLVTATSGNKVESSLRTPDNFRTCGNFSVPDNENFWVYYLTEETSSYTGYIYVSKISTSTYTVEKTIILNNFMDSAINKQTGFTFEWCRDCTINFSKDFKFLFICNGRTKRILIYSVDFNRKTETFSLKFLSNTIGATDCSVTSNYYDTNYFCLPLGTDHVHFD